MAPFLFFCHCFISEKNSDPNKIYCVHFPYFRKTLATCTQWLQDDNKVEITFLCKPGTKVFHFFFWPAITVDISLQNRPLCLARHQAMGGQTLLFSGGKTFPPHFHHIHKSLKQQHHLHQGCRCCPRMNPFQGNPILDIAPRERHLKIGGKVELFIKKTQALLNQINV